MKKLAFGALLVGLLVACGGGDSNKIKIIDASNIDAPGVCNPLTQAGCMAGEKCTWLVDALMPQYVGHIGCAPDGGVAAGGACMYGAPGATGYDDCAKGHVCSNYRSSNPGVCKTLCDNAGGNPMCPSTHVCVTYSGLFTTTADAPAAAGVCDLACDPFTDNDFDGSGAGGTLHMTTTNTCPDVGMNVTGCYGYPSFGTPPKSGWSCTGDINAAATGNGWRHRAPCNYVANDPNSCADQGPQIYVNSCNQGHLPLLYEMTGSTTVICTSMCKPADCYTDDNNVVQCGGNGNPNRLGVQPHRCNLADRPNATSMDTGAGREHCDYLWDYEVDQMGNFLRSPTSDTMGFCFDHGQYRYDSNADNMPDMALPACAPLKIVGPGTDPTMPLTYFGAEDLGCIKTALVPSFAGMVNGKAQLSPEMMRKRAMIDRPRGLHSRVMGAKQ